MVTAVALTRVDGWELDTSTGDDPRVRDIDVAERGGLAQPRDVRRVIEKNRAELEQHGPIDMRARQARISKPNGGEEFRSVVEFWLNEAQAISLVAMMRTKEAVALRVSLVKLFVAFRRGQLAAAPPPLSLDVANGPRIGEVPTLRAEVSRRCRMVARATGRSLQSVHGSVRQVFRVPGVYQLSALAWQFAGPFLEALALGEIVMPRKQKAPVLRLLDARQVELPFGDSK